MYTLPRNFYNIILSVADSKWEKVEKRDTVWRLLIPYGPECKIAYRLCLSDTTYIVGMSNTRGIVLYVIEPYASVIHFISNCSLVTYLFNAVNEYQSCGTYAINEEIYDVLPDIKLSSKLPQTYITTTVDKLFQQLPEARQYAVFDLLNGVRVVGCYNVLGECTHVYLYNVTSKWYLRVDNESAINFWIKRFDMAIGFEPKGDKRAEEILYNFLSVYAPTAILDIERLRIKNPDMSLYQLSKLAKNSGGTK